MRGLRLVAGLFAVALAGGTFAAPAWALAPSHANITFKVGSTVNQLSGGELVGSALVVWTPGTSDVGAVCCTNDVQNAIDDSFLEETTTNRYPFTWDDDDSYRFEIDSYDALGNYVGSAFTNAPTYISEIGEISETFGTYTGSWNTQNTASALDGSLKYSTAKGASVSFTDTVRALGWVTTVGPTHGSAKIYIDGKLVKTVSTHAGTTGYRRVKFSRAWWGGPNDAAHTIKIVNAGTPGHSRVDVDGFLNIAED